MSASASSASPAPESATPIRFGIIGAGFIARWFMEAVGTVADAQVVAVTSAHPERAAAFAAEHAIPAAFASLADMLAAEDDDGGPLVDVVYIGSPNLLHPEHTLAALAAGRHVLVEKPFAPTPAQARAMVAAARRNDRLLMEGWLPAFEPGVAVVRDNLPRLGPVRRALLVKEQYSSRMDAYRAGSLPPAFNPALAGGSLMDLGVYPVNLAIHLFGPPARVTATGVLLEEGADALGTVVLGYDGLAATTAGAARETQPAGFEVVCLHSKTSPAGTGSAISGDHVVLALDDCQWPRRIELRGADAPDADGADAVADLSVTRTGPALAYELEAFCRLVRSGARESDLHPLANSVAAVEVLYEARRQVGVHFPGDPDRRP
ncbi:Gfo/Idh/MocA family protein [Actinomyces ruminicola]|uniref:Predicted dehydrogenase n=1 Tax=Actinomyces ruminicola TaxID=332524 RepID=A0A1G9YTY6_9ACTO|nr:Gfo/Idh/MocA family oxidoreductase [Actinomyces ruminicola]SDN12612.1 Predicted dehydrogenase [Actinomyces ruminicola]